MKATATYLDVVHHRRLSLCQRISSAFAVLLSLFTLGVGVMILQGNLPKSWGFGAICTLIGWVAAFGIAVLSARRGQEQRAVGWTLGATLGTILSFDAFWCYGVAHRLDAIAQVQWTSLCMGILLVGILGTRWLVVGTTLLMNLWSVVLLVTLGHDLPVLFDLILILGQWTVAALAIALIQLYSSTLRDLSTAYTQARQVDAMKDAFITHVNHELRTPVMVLFGYVDLLRSAGAQISPERQHTLLDQAHEAGTNLVELLEGILDVRSIDSPSAPVALERVDGVAALAKAIQALPPEATERPIRVLGTATFLWADPLRLAQILTNLLTNALKYSAPGTAIELSCVRVRQQVEIRVRDYGLGIPPKEIPLLFQRFVRLPRDLASATSANGLGLYLCRVYAASMGGTIHAESSGIAGEGTVMVLALPAATATEEARDDWRAVA